MLDGRAGVLLLTRIHDRLGTESIQGPAHSGELRRGDNEIDLSTPKPGFKHELTPRMRVVVQDEIPDDPGREVGEWGDFQTAIPQLLPADHLAPTLLVVNGAGRTMGTYKRWLLSQSESFVRVLVRSKKH